jgi:hypothetical protein
LADFEGRIHGLHLVVIAGEALGVRPGIMGLIRRIGVDVLFPTAAAFIAHFPVFDVGMIGNFTETDPVRRLAGCAAAVIDDEKHLRAGVGGQMEEVGGAGAPALGFVGHEISVAPTAAGPAQGLIVHVRQDEKGVGGVEISVPSRGVDGEHPIINRAHGVGGVDAEVDERGGRIGGQSDVGNVKVGLRRSAGPNFDALEIGHISDAQLRQGDGELLPGIGWGCHPGLVSPGRTSFRQNANRLASSGTAIQPQREIGVQCGINGVMLQRPRLPGIAGVKEHRVCSAKTRIVGGVMRHPSPILPSIIQHPGVNQHVIIGQKRCGQGKERRAGQSEPRAGRENHECVPGRIAVFNVGKMKVPRTAMSMHNQSYDSPAGRKVKQDGLQNGGIVRQVN